MPREIFTVHTWRFIEYRFLPACSFGTSAEAWSWVREQIELGKDMSRFRVIASEADDEAIELDRRAAA
jgi:hypothetical protein